MKDIDSQILAPRGRAASFLDEDGDACFDIELIDSTYAVFEKISSEIQDHIYTTNTAAKIGFMFDFARHFSLEAVVMMARYSSKFHGERKQGDNFTKGWGYVSRKHKEYVESLRAELARHDAYLAQFKDAE